MHFRLVIVTRHLEVQYEVRRDPVLPYLCPFGWSTEYSVRTGMEAVYQLLNVDRGVPEVFGSIYDVRELIKSTAFLRDREKVSVPFFVKKYVEKTMIGRLLEEYGVI